MSGKPWAVQGFLLPVRPGLMPCQVLLQIAELWLARNWACQGGMLLAQRIVALGENLVSTAPPWPAPFKHYFLLAVFLREEASDGFVLVLDAPRQGPGQRQECLTQQSCIPASCLSAAAAAVTAWVSRREMQLLKCLPSVSGRGWHPATAAPPIQQLKGCSFLREPETGSAKRAFWWRVRNPHFSKSVEIWLYEKASLSPCQKPER